MSNPFFEHPILNSPYACPQRHWELDGDGQPTQQIIEDRRKAQFISPIPKPKKRKASTDQQQFVFDGHGEDDLLNLIVEIKGYRGEDAKDKKSTMDTYWIPGVNQLKTYGRWAFAEFTDIYEIESDFAAKVESQFNDMLKGLILP